MVLQVLQSISEINSLLCNKLQTHKRTFSTQISLFSFLHYNSPLLSFTQFLINCQKTRRQKKRTSLEAKREGKKLWQQTMFFFSFSSGECGAVMNTTASLSLIRTALVSPWDGLRQTPQASPQRVLFLSLPLYIS